jgi:hypothetical protein
MDPNANLQEQREIVRWLLDINEENADELSKKTDRLAQLVEALDDWLSKGGFPPKAWDPEERRAARQRALDSR